MAYQNFYSESNNYRRKKPATCSGKRLDGEIRMRYEGSSALAVKYHGYEETDGEIALHVAIYHPETGKTLFDETVRCQK